MTGMKDIFKNIDESVKTQVHLGDDKQVQTAGKCIITIKTKSDKEKQIHDALYIPGLAYNLLSIGQLAQNGYLVIFQGNTYKIHDLKSGVHLITVNMNPNKTFPLEFSSLDDHALISNLKSDIWLWHMKG